MALTTRSHTWRSLPLWVALTALPLVSGAGAAEASVEFRGLSTEQQAIARWATDLFSEARLELPNVIFVAGSDPDDCDGFDGLARPEQGHVQITLCTDHVGWAGELLILHEVAHAWDFHNLSSEDRARFSAHRGARTWLDRDVDWHERGAEQAAEIMVWGLIDRPLDPVKIHANTCPELQAGYEILTGQTPLHGFTDYC
jgi:hypothetical protein